MAWLRRNKREGGSDEKECSHEFGDDRHFKCGAVSKFNCNE